MLNTCLQKALYQHMRDKPAEEEHAVWMDKFHPLFIIAGNHSSAALVSWSKRKGKQPLRGFEIYRFSQFGFNTEVVLAFAKLDNIGAAACHGYNTLEPAKYVL